MRTLYRNQSIDLRCKSIDWFLYGGNIGRLYVKFVKINNKDRNNTTIN